MPKRPSNSAAAGAQVSRSNRKSRRSRSSGQSSSNRIPPLESMITIRKKLRWLDAVTAVSSSVSITDMFLLLAARVDATHVNQVYTAFRIHSASLYASSASSTPGIIAPGCEIRFSDDGAVQCKGQKEVGLAVGAAGVTRITITPPSDSLVSKWVTSGSGNILDVVVPANTSAVLELDVEFQLDPDLQSSALVVTSTTAAALQQRRLMTSFLPVAWETYIP